jgi:hypothetical protein
LKTVISTSGNLQTVSISRKSYYRLNGYRYDEAKRGQLTGNRLR